MNNDSFQHKVSVIIPTYNRAEFLPNAVRSIIDQDYGNIEIIIVDDGSVDDTRAVVAKLQEGYPNIIFCHNERSKGPSGARNTGMIKATGNYLSFLDSDDVWLEGHLKGGVKVLEENPGIDVLFGNFSIVDFDTGKQRYNFFDEKKLLHTLNSIQLLPNVKVLHDNLLLALVHEGFFHLGGTILRKSLIKGIFFDESIMFTEDRDFAIRLYTEAKAVFAFTEDPVFILYVHNSNLYNNSDDSRWQKTIGTHLYLFNKYLTAYELSTNEKKILSKIILKLYLNLSYLYWKDKEIKNVLLQLLKGFKYGFVILKLYISSLFQCVFNLPLSNCF